MLTKFADPGQHADAFFVIRAISIANCTPTLKTTHRRQVEMESRMFRNQLMSVLARSSSHSFALSFGAFRLPPFCIVLNYFVLHLKKCKYFVDS